MEAHKVYENAETGAATMFALFDVADDLAKESDMHMRVYGFDYEAGPLVDDAYLLMRELNDANVDCKYVMQVAQQTGRLTEAVHNVILNAMA